MRMRIKTIQTSNKNFILKYFRCRDGKRTETRIGMEGICITHSCIPPLSHYVLHVHSVQWNAGMGNTDTLHPNSCLCSFSIPTSEIFLLLVDQEIVVSKVSSVESLHRLIFFT